MDENKKLNVAKEGTMEAKVRLRLRRANKEQDYEKRLYENQTSIYTGID